MALDATNARNDSAQAANDNWDDENPFGVFEGPSPFDILAFDDFLDIISEQFPEWRNTDLWREMVWPYRKRAEAIRVAIYREGLDD